jgi:O-antigen/teichoic acid export membrane protein
MLMLGGNQTAANCVVYLSRSLDSILIGRFWGAGPLGLYSKAQALLLLPVRQLDAPLAVVALPALSRIQDDPERQARYYLRIANLLMWATTPLVGFLFVAAHPVIALLLGDQWRESAVVFRIFAACAPAFPLLQLNTLLFQSRGRTDRLLKVTLISAPVLMGSVLLGLPFGTRGVALAYTLATLAVLPWVFAFTFRGTRLTLGRFGRAILFPVSVCLGAVLAGLVALHLAAPEGVLPSLSLVALAFAVVYALGVLLPPVRRELLSLRDLLRELRPAERTR